MFSKWRLGAYFAQILNVIALPLHLFALLLKIVNFNTANGAKNSYTAL